MEGGKKIMKTATLIMKVFRAASSCVSADSALLWLVSFEIIICAMVRRRVLVINISVLPHVVNFVSHSSCSLLPALPVQAASASASALGSPGSTRAA